jgi:hypothetical protein
MEELDCTDEMETLYHSLATASFLHVSVLDRLHGRRAVLIGIPGMPLFSRCRNGKRGAQGGRRIISICRESLAVTED